VKVAACYARVNLDEFCLDGSTGMQGAKSFDLSTVGYSGNWNASASVLKF